jgi:hypothetical protein
MSTEHLGDVAKPEIGKFYLVPCVRVGLNAKTVWMDSNCWVPVIGPKHIDAEHLEFTYEHYHIDWRFVGRTAWKYATSGPSGSALGRVLTNSDGDAYKPLLNTPPALRRIKCKREMPTFPTRKQIPDRWGTDHGIKWERLERAQAITCNKLKPGNICPHRGIDLTSFAQPDGTAVCPGPGLRWNLNTGELMPRFAPGVQS